MELVKKIALGGGMTAGAVVTYELFELAKSNPRVLEIALSWGPLFVIVVLGMILIDRRVGDGVSALKENARAQQQMSDAMQKIAERDDRQAERLETLINYSALQSEKVLNALEEQRDRLDRHSYFLAQIGEVVKIRIPATELAVAEQANKAKGASA